jgi:hypothetical protein
MPELEKGQRERALKYYEKFYETINDARKYEREVVRSCIEVPD